MSKNIGRILKERSLFWLVCVSSEVVFILNLFIKIFFVDPMFYAYDLTPEAMSLFVPILIYYIFSEEPQ